MPTMKISTECMCFFNL